MSTGTILAIVIPAAVLIVVIASAFALDFRRRRRLRGRFGPEYGRTVDEAGNRRAAPDDLGEREERHASPDSRPLPDHVRERYLREWHGVQGQFADRPEAAVHDADRLVNVLMRERGYPTEDVEQRPRDLPVEHGRALEHFREAHETALLAAAHRATAEQLHGAMAHYRALFDELLSDGDQAGPGAPER